MLLGLLGRDVASRGGVFVTVKNAGRVNLSAIAQAAGVSVPTVSRVLNGRSDVSPLTRERVETDTA